MRYAIRNVSGAKMENVVLFFVVVVVVAVFSHFSISHQYKLILAELISMLLLYPAQNLSSFKSQSSHAGENIE